MAELQNPSPKKLFTEAELAAELCLSPWTVRRFRLFEGMPVISIAGRFFYRIEAVEKWLKSRETSGATDEEPGESGKIREIKP